MFSFNKSTETKDQRVSALEERINALEQQNASIMREMHNMTFHYFQQLERLDRRITDFGDALPPMMAANMVRIKDEVVAETQTHNVVIMQQIKSNMQEYVEQQIKFLITADPLCGYVVVGYKGINPVFANKHKINTKYFGPTNLTTIIRMNTDAFIVDSIASFPEIKHFELADFRSFPGNPDSLETPIMIDINGYSICNSIKGKPKYSQVEKLDKAFAKYGVELLYEGKPIRFSI